MLRMPTKGFSESIHRHNCDVEPFVDWVEASVLFLGDPVSRSDIVDRLIENSIYRDQEFAHKWVDIVFAELRRRIKALSQDVPIAIERSSIVRRTHWRERPAYSFCVALSMQVHYRENIPRPDFHIQGKLFEDLIAESLRANNWSVTSVGWSHETTRSIDSRVHELAAAIGEEEIAGAVGQWTEKHAKDSGLDLIIWQPFPDGRSGRPICLVQCASGENWDEKLHTPDLRTWQHLISFTTEPRRGLAMPFAPDHDDFRKKAGRDGVMLLLDRHRILHVRRGGAFPSTNLSRRLVDWTQDRIRHFPSE